MRQHRFVVIGCSAGGVRALGVVLAALRADLGAPVVVVCHTGGDDVDMLCEVLSLVSKLPVQEAAERHAPKPGVVYLAPAGYHLLIGADGHFELSIDARVSYSRPAIDVLFESAAARHGAALVGVVLTGANEDGAEGLKRIRAHRGLAIVQAPTEAEAAAMPEAALRIAGADHTAKLADIAALINQHCP